MPRKLRLEFPGACYHVINRGNYRSDVFATSSTKAAFVTCLFEVCAKSGWVLHAFVVMRNHYHLAVETPAGNLVAGMQWLQSTFANRFNRLRGERGHLFQGRFKALIVEEGIPLAQVCHYIHLNPVRAGILPVDRLGEYQHSSFPYMRRPNARPKFLQFQTALAGAGGLADERAGWLCYASYLAWQVMEGPAGKSDAYVNMSRGWAVGGTAFKTALHRDHAVATESRAWETHGVQEARELRWQAALTRALEAVDKTPADALASPKSAGWKLAVAAWLKLHCQASNGWIARQLHLGCAASFSSNLTRYRRHAQASDPVWHVLTQIFAA